MLGVEPHTPAEELTTRYQHLFKANSADASKSFYLQSKVQRAYERIGQEIGLDTSNWRGFAASGEDKGKGAEQASGNRPET